MARRPARRATAALLLAALAGVHGCTPGAGPHRRLPDLLSSAAPSAGPHTAPPEPLPASLAAAPLLEGALALEPSPEQADEPAVAAAWQTLDRLTLAAVRAPEGPGDAGPGLGGHGPDYGWVSGRLQYAQVRGVWCLRYAGPEADDRYGGRVTLVGPAEWTGLRDGLRVRVEGRLLDPASREPSPLYEVTALHVFPSDR